MTPSYKMLIFSFIVSLHCLVPWTAARSVGESPAAVLNMTVVHINDIHAHFEETNVMTGRCRAEDVKGEGCYGGMARVQAKRKQLMEEDPDALFLNAGDFYQGTVWYTVFKYAPLAEVGRH